MIFVNLRWKLVLCSVLLLSCRRVIAQGGDVTATFTVTPSGSKVSKHPAMNNIVLWLTPVDGSEPVRASPPPATAYRLVQKNKEFLPHLLVVPAGSSVDFPNLDPFFHNVFSLFNGKRFDLGLYEAGQHRSVRFDREGVSYIFCNIHPEMGAVILALKTPYYAVSDASGAVTIHNVPPGQYRLHMWSEQYQGSDSAPNLRSAQRMIQVSAQGASLGSIALSPAPNPLTNHKNKFGEDYPATPAATY
jgi:plastocyanin